MRNLLKASIFALAATWSLTGQAATVAYNALPADGSYFAPTAVASTAPYSPDVTGSIGGIRTSPFNDDTTRYNSVGANGSATFGVLPPAPSPSEDAQVFNAAFVNGPPSSGFGTGSGTFTFVWGTPDTYNRLSFYNGATLLDTVTGSGNGTGSYLATVSGLGSYDRVVFESIGQNAFEFAAVSPVPLPASLPMFGGAVLALGGFAMLRRGRAGAPAKAGA